MPSEPGSSELVRELRGIGQSLDGIPHPALWVGLAGTLPYLGTAVGSLFLSWNISKFHSDFVGSFSEKFVVFSPETAEYWLPILQTVQVGYGACILSFLGAIHWGFEMSGYGGEVGIKRYIYGAAPALIAWPSILLPVDFALIAHFITFTGVWFADAAAARKGLAPGWYNQYRFLLTFIVCSSILLTLIVSGWLGDPQQATPHSSRLESLREEEVRQFDKDNGIHKPSLTIAFPLTFSQKPSLLRPDLVSLQRKTRSKDKVMVSNQSKIIVHGLIISDQETMNDKEKETQAQDRQRRKELKNQHNDGNTEEESADSDEKPPQDGEDVKQNPDKKGSKQGCSKEPAGSSEKSDPDGDDPVDAKKNSGATDNKTTSKEDTSKEAAEGKGAEKSGQQKK